MAQLAPWIAEYPGAMVYPANVDNVQWGFTVAPTHIVLHTPEEEADNYFATPVWFSQYHPTQRGSTNTAISYFGFVTECVGPNTVPIANGVIGKPYPPGADPNLNLNQASRSVEIEGRAATMHLTCPRGSSQWNAVVNWCAFLCKKYGLGVDRIIRHSDVANNRGDPGTLDVDGIRADVAAKLQPTPIQETEDEMQPVVIREDGTDKFALADGKGKKMLSGLAEAVAYLKVFRQYGPDGKTITGGEIILSAGEFAALKEV